MRSPKVTQRGDEIVLVDSEALPTQETLSVTSATSDTADHLIRSGQLLPRSARPPWAWPDVLVVADDLPSYLKRERGFRALTPSGLSTLAELPRPSRGRRARGPVIAVPDFHALDESALDELATVQRGGIPVLPLASVLERRCRMHVLLGAATAPQGEVKQPRLPYRIAKRAIDLVVAFLGMLLFLLVLPFVAVAILVESRGPIFYTQERVGQGGRTFRLLKFRSMKINAEPMGPAWSRSEDDRVTRVGGVLRRTKLDELPQVLNILLGHMSLVGPRPERPFFVRILAGQVPHYELRHLVRPGLTGWGTIRVGYGNSIEAKLMQHQYDLYHLRKSSLLFDAEVLLRSVLLVTFRARSIDRYMV